MKKQVPEYKVADDGTFFIAFKDYVKFFYVTSICFYTDNNHQISVQDEPDADTLGICKLTIPEDTQKMISMSLNQIDARFTDDTMRGEYSYAEIKFIITKIADRKGDDEGKTMIKEQVFLDGNKSQSQNVTIPFKHGLKQGEYLLMYNVGFNSFHQIRKVVLNIYSDLPEAKLEILDSLSYETHDSQEDRLAQCEQILNERMQCLDESIELQ